MLLVTRPREQALQWVAQLQGSGIAAAAVPLLGIHAAPDPQALSAARRQLASGQFRAVMFVSPNAVDAFLDGGADPGQRFSWPERTWAVAPGPGTAVALQACGIPSSLIIQPPADARQFDSESLWPELSRHSWQDTAVLVVRAEEGRDWLIDRWKASGAHVHAVAAYRRGPPVLLPGERAVLRQAVEVPEDCVWLLSSSEALTHLMPLAAEIAPSPDLAGWLKRSRGLATHPRILASAQQLGMGLVRACRPDLPSVVDSYNRLHRDA